ncbi:MAG: hypothetical protein RLZZ175_577 [Bacteroidota bacterium]|jgi:hypothetical protein
MKRLFLMMTVGAFVLSSFTSDVNKAAQESFLRGELLSYRLHYGFVNAGVADIQVMPLLYQVNNRICYRMNINGRTTGSFDMFLKIRDQFGAYIDTATMRPQKSYRLIQEGNYKLTEITQFDHDSNKVVVNSDGKDKIYKTPSNVKDIVSSYYYLRTIDFSKVKIGDIIVIKSFLENTTYDFSMKYLGKQKIKTDIGKVNSIILSPIMPENKLFKGKNAIKAWFSDDKNRIPLKAEAEMFVGSVDLDITAVKGLRHSLNKD